ncbi:hypothetical protein [Pseudomonas sp. CJQ_13]|uniref:hypothetical protein n=1 Tax=Pseudomonas sp. CJQ_13 TaxID=3367170 RepID=UPI00370AF774
MRIEFKSDSWFYLIVFFALFVRGAAVQGEQVPRIITASNPEHEISEHNAEMFGPPKERLDFDRREGHYETSILANRTDAYLAAQPFLVIQ